MTGIASNRVFQCNLTEAANVVKEENERVAKILGINSAARCTTVKPAGTISVHEALPFTAMAEQLPENPLAEP